MGNATRPPDLGKRLPKTVQSGKSAGGVGGVNEFPSQSLNCGPGSGPFVHDAFERLTRSKRGRFRNLGLVIALVSGQAKN
jgi:hypothetical protein